MKATKQTEPRDRHEHARGVFFAVQKALPLMKEGGSVILTGSGVWQKGIPTYPTYGATKAALRSFVRTWTAELAGKGIRANVISPGPVETPILNGQFGENTDAMKERFKTMIPMGRIGQPEERDAIAPRESDEQVVFMNRSNTTSKIVAVFYMTWACLHLLGAYSVYVLGRSPDSSMVKGRVFQNACNLLFFSIIAFSVAATLNWRNSVSGYWINFATLGIAHTGLIFFVLVPGYAPVWPSILGPAFWVLATIFSTLAILTRNKGPRRSFTGG